MKTIDLSREEQMAMVQGMLLSNMLDFLGISLKQYFRNTFDRDRRRHIHNCKTCPSVSECVHMLLGEEIDPEKFCPNYKEIKCIKNT